MALSAEQTGPASCIVRDGGETVCEVHNLRLQHARFRPGGTALIGGTVPLPLFWEQYADHEDPERNAGNHASLKIAQSARNEIEIVCAGSTLSRSLASAATLLVRRDPESARTTYDITTTMRVNDGMEWRVTPNPQQGELEFCNLWPEGIFAPDPHIPLRYQSTYVRHGDRTLQIPHHHLESPDKENIRLSQGDQVAWLLEDENLCCSILEADPVTAAVCAYMWDLHLAYRVCLDGMECRLPAGAGARARYRLSSLTREEGRAFMAGAVEDVNRGLADAALFRDGISLFSGLRAKGVTDLSGIWPWEQEVLSGNREEIHFAVEPDQNSGGAPTLSIVSNAPAHAAWKVTGLGPAFRQPPLPDASRYRLTASVRGDSPSGTAALSIRLHREDSPGLFDISTYDVFTSTVNIEPDRWTKAECVTPAISPPPDRLHLLCELRGDGFCTFADIRFETIP